MSRAAAPTVSSPLAAFAVAVAGIGIFSAMDAVMKGLVLALGVFDTMLWRSWAGVVVSGLFYAAVRPPRPSRAALRLHLVRGAVTTVMALTFFWGLARVPMAQAIALAFTAPLAALFLAAAMLGERLSARALAASLLATAGVGVILTGQWQAAMGPDALRGAAAVLFSAGCYALNIILMRQQAQVAGPVEVAFSQSLVVAVLLALAAPAVGTTPPAGHAVPLVAAAAMSVASLLLLAFAYARAPASYLAPSEYTGFLWAALLGWWVFGERVSAWTLAGAVLIVVACILAARAEAPAPQVEPGV